MVEVTPVVEVDFAGTGTWTDITPWVRVADRITITRGRGDEQSEVKPATMSLVLDNRDRRFTPLNASSPYYPNVRKGVPIRAAVVVSGVTYRRFHGTVNEWPVSFDGGGRLVLSRVTATDTFKRLGGLAPMRSLLEEEMLALNPDAYYTLGESSGSTAGDTSGDGQNELSVFQVASTGGAVNFGQGTGPGTDGLPAVVFAPASSTAGKGIHADMLARPTDGNWVVACWITTTTPGREFLQLGYQLYPTGLMCTAVGTAAAGQVRVRSYWFSAGVPDATQTIGGPNIADGATHFVVIRRRASDNAVFTYVDGASIGSGAVIPNTAPSNQYNLLSVGGFMHGAVADLFAGTVAHVWYANLNAMPNWANVWTAGNGSSESTTARFSRLCRLLGLTGRVVGTSTAQIAPQTATGKAPAQALRDVAGVEMGLVYAARDDGAVVFECRNHRWDKPPALTLTKEALLEGSLQWTDDDQLMLNDVTNQREGGAVQRAADPVSIAKFGRYTDGQTLPWATDRDAYLNAYYRMINGANPEPRVKAFSVATNTLTSYAAVLALDLSDVVRLDNLPPGSPRTDDVDVFIEGYTESIEYGLHTITFHTSPGQVFHP